MNRQTTRQKPQTATLRVAGAAEILPVLRDFGANPNEVLARAGITPNLFDDPGNLITYAARDRLFTECVAETGCPHFGLLVGQRMNLNSLGLIGMLMRTSPDVGTALRSLVEYLHLHSEGAVTTLQIDGEVAMLTYDALPPGLEASDQTGDGAVAMMLNVMDELCGPQFWPIEASFSHRKPHDIEVFNKLFRVPLYFDARYYALVFARTWLDVCPPGADVEIHRLLQDQTNMLVARQSLEFPQQVRNVLHSALLTGEASEEQVAALFSMSSRTLARRLEDFDTGFHEIADECRFNIARQMLSNTSISIGQISATLGYSRASSFIRAFRRWSGDTPARWRAAQTGDV